MYAYPFHEKTKYSRDPARLKGSISNYTTPPLRISSGFFLKKKAVSCWPSAIPFKYTNSLFLSCFIYLASQI